MNDFYGLAAQVIPVFLLVAAVEARTIGMREQIPVILRRRVVWLFALNMLNMLVAEGLAFYAVGKDTSSPLLVFVVGSGVAGSALLCAFGLLLPWITSVRS